MHVYMPAGHTGPFSFGARRGGDGLRQSVDEFVEEFENDIIPYAEKHYRVSTDRKNRAVAGLSMGGAPATPTGPSWEEQHRKGLDDAKLKKGLKLIWFATGRDDFLIGTTRATVEMLKKHGFNPVFNETEGAHTWIVWREYL